MQAHFQYKKIWFSVPSYKKESVGLKMYFTIANVVTGLLCTNQEVFQQLIESLSVNCISNLIYCIMHCAGKRHLKKIPKKRSKSLTVIKISLYSYLWYMLLFHEVKLDFTDLYVETWNGNYWIHNKSNRFTYESVPDIL